MNVSFRILASFTINPQLWMDHRNAVYRWYTDTQADYSDVEDTCAALFEEFSFSESEIDEIYDILELWSDIDIVS